jgi:hypothetical protein
LAATSKVEGEQEAAPRHVSRTKTPVGAKKVTNRPSSLMEGDCDPLIGAPCESVEIKLVDEVQVRAPAQVSLTYTKKAPVVAAGLRFVADEEKTVKRPSSVMAEVSPLGAPEGPFAWVPSLATETGWIEGVQPEAPRQTSLTNVKLKPDPAGGV